MKTGTKRDRFVAQIVKAEAELSRAKGRLAELQRLCPHPSLVSENVLVYQDSWTDYYCPDCGWRTN